MSSALIRKWPLVGVVRKTNPWPRRGRAGAATGCRRGRRRVRRSESRGRDEADTEPVVAVRPDVDLRRLLSRRDASLSGPGPPSRWAANASRSPRTSRARRPAAGRADTGSSSAPTARPAQNPCAPSRAARARGSRSASSNGRPPPARSALRRASSRDSRTRTAARARPAPRPPRPAASRCNASSPSPYSSSGVAQPPARPAWCESRCRSVMPSHGRRSPVTGSSSESSPSSTSCQRKAATSGFVIDAIRNVVSGTAAAVAAHVCPTVREHADRERGHAETREQRRRRSCRTRRAASIEAVPYSAMTDPLDAAREAADELRARTGSRPLRRRARARLGLEAGGRKPRRARRGATARPNCPGSLPPRSRARRPDPTPSSGAANSAPLPRPHAPVRGARRRPAAHGVRTAIAAGVHTVVLTNAAGGLGDPSPVGSRC